MVEGERKLSRRKFLRLSSSAIYGGVVGAGALPLAGGTSTFVTEKITGKNSGNADFIERVERDCEDSSDPACEDNYKFNFTPVQTYGLVVEAPITEELIYRAVPSLLLSASNNEDVVDTFLYGSDGNLVKKELTAGIATSVVFGLRHNLTPSGFRTDVIPTSQILAGFGFWGLMRRKGIAANVAAHSALNSLAYTFLRFSGRA